MFKLLGAVLVLFAGAMIGFHQAAQYTRRPRQIRQLIHALQHLETEIVYGFTPLSEALMNISKQMAGPVSAMISQASVELTSLQGNSALEAWQRAVKENWPKTAMKINEQDIINRLGFTLGTTDREDQVKHLHLAVSQLKGAEATAAEEQKLYEKMWKSLGVLAGALVVILMY